MIRKTLKKIITYIRLKLCLILINEKTVLLISHDFSLSGAPIVLLNTAEILKSHGYNVIILSPLKGKLESVVKSKKIKYFVTYNMTKLKSYNRVLKKAKFIIVNTIVNYETIHIINNFEEKNQKVLWWIHEGNTYISKYQDKIERNLKNNILIMPVSLYVKDKLDEANLFENCEKYLLPYYLNDINNEYQTRNREKYTIAIVGSICPRKNQIDVIDALNYNKNENLTEHILLCIVGDSIDDKYYSELKEKLEKSNIRYKMINSIPKNEMNTFYQNIDLLVCPSIDDPLPVVVSEAMQNAIPVLCSNHTGQYGLITDGYNGFTYDVTNVEELSKKIQNIFSLQTEELLEIGNNEKKLVDEVLSKKNFENKLISILKG